MGIICGNVGVVAGRVFRFLRPITCPRQRETLARVRLCQHLPCSTGHHLPHFRQLGPAYLLYWVNISIGVHPQIQPKDSCKNPATLFSVPQGKQMQREECPTSVAQNYFRIAELKSNTQQRRKQIYILCLHAS